MPKTEPSRAVTPPSSPPTPSTRVLSPSPALDVPEASLTSVLADLAEKRAQLDALDTQIADLIRRVEAALRTHFNIRVETTINGHVDYENGWETVEVLAFGKWDNRWQLLILVGDPNDPESWSTTPLLSAVREVRASVFLDGSLEKLIRDAAKLLSQEIANRQIALQKGSALALALEPITKEAP
jgi:hypothetical protein